MRWVREELSMRTPMRDDDLLTTCEYLATPYTVLPRELAHGRLRVADAPLVSHQRAVAQLFLALHHHVRHLGAGEVWLAPLDVVLDADRALVVQPDMLVVSPERQHIVRERVYGAPDLVVEVLSPGPRVGRVEERLVWYARYDVRECWLLHQVEDVLEVIRFENGRVSRRHAYGLDHRIESGVLPRFDGTLRSIRTE